MYSLDVDYKEVSRYLGVKDEQLDGELKREIVAVTERLRSEVSVKIEYKVFDIVVEEHGVKVCGTTLVLEGKAIRALLKDCKQCILMAVTLGQKVDALMRRLQITDLSQAVMMDFCASSMVEQVCNQAEDEWKGAWMNKNLYFTDRFSPGYGDLPIEIQKNFCEVLDTARKMGIHVSGSGLMIPKKSITAIVGIADTQQRMKIKGCKYCGFYKDCQYRKDGRICD